MAEAAARRRKRQEQRSPGTYAIRTTRLLQAAELYGVRPTTLARMMVVRGVNAIHDAELARRARLLRDE